MNGACNVALGLEFEFEYNFLCVTELQQIGTQNNFNLL
jgi:hypothetical protein